ncbi:hypothetical protein PR048_010158 [Dryococelus australis]|uniref:DNA helicase Pif1-like 2B domain-containing protein n=1 Tax=Dryococelus australis TaxID=614101 RepID=A0ABQ9I2Y6_9NEOP|nr:hypothetical protein PR048_010158 [Dryococelus australis]
MNTIINEEESVHFPVEFLNSIVALGLPAHKIQLKIGVLIMLLRNLNPENFGSCITKKKSSWNLKFKPAVVKGTQFLYYGSLSSQLTNLYNLKGFSSPLVNVS